MKNKSQQGMILVSIIIIFPILIFLTITFLTLTASGFSIARRDQMRTHAQLTADAGVDYALYEISENADWTGTAGVPITLQNDTDVRTSYDITVTNVDDNHKLVTSVGRVYSPASETTPASTITLKVTLRAVRAGGSYSIVTGVGGLYLSNSSKILGGDVLVNGEISMSNTSQIGLSNNAVNVDVAHQNCPFLPDATYPRLCNPGEGGESVTLNNSAHIYGSVKANGQVSGAGMSNPGLIASSGVTPQALPTHDRVAQKAAAVNNLTGDDASCTSNGGTKTWPANVKITGNVTISHTCKVTILGDAWITGSLYMANSGQIIIDNSLGTTRPTIMIDGLLGVLRNGSAIISNSSKTGAQIINYWSAASCSPDCADVTGLELFLSRIIITLALDNTGGAENSIFYSRWSRVLVSNTGAIGALVGQTVQLTNSGMITFGTTVNPGGGDAHWVISEYKRGI
jgi:hypothetical protein